MRVLPLLLLGALSCGVPQGDGLNIPDGFIQRVGGDPTASGSRLKLQILAGDDGSRQPAGFWDTKLNSTCAAFRDESGDLRCFPSVAQTFYYSDPACKEPLFPATDCPTPPPFGVESIQRQGCGSFAFYRAYKINSAIVKPTTVYYGPFGTCIATAATPDAKYWTSTRVPDTDFVLMTMKVL